VPDLSFETFEVDSSCESMRLESYLPLQQGKDSIQNRIGKPGEPKTK
jgi:hypothetical protein